VTTETPGTPGHHSVDGTRREEIDSYLSTGHSDPLFFAWPGDVFERSRMAETDLRSALITEVERRAAAAPPQVSVPELDLVAFTRARVEPMVRGLFPRDEQEAVLGVLERSVVLLTPANIADVLRNGYWLHTAWDLANLFLASVGADLLGPDATGIVGLSEETTCYITPEYFAHQGRFDDFIVHEAAHVFHNCKRHTMGLPESRNREWPLAIDFGKRETLAYACEAFSRIAEHGPTRTARLALVAEVARRGPPDEDRVDPREYLDILGEAASAQNGWKRILARCAPARRARRATAVRAAR
jgi:hypothetical protein